MSAEGGNESNAMEQVLAELVEIRKKVSNLYTLVLVAFLLSLLGGCAAAFLTF